MAEPAYVQIAAEIRRRIADGDLTPGERAPSTRQIAREWGVAMATATRALGTLRDEGVVLARPRSGTVVAPTGVRKDASPPGAAPADTFAPTRDRVVRAGIELADAEGLAALSMRGVANRLGVATMTPYRHVKDKEDLVLLMADAAFGELAMPAAPPTNWRTHLELAARELWKVHRRHPWLAHVTPLTRPLLLPGVLAYAEHTLAALRGHGLDPVTVFDLHVLLFSHVEGLAANLEDEARYADSTGLTDAEWTAEQERGLARRGGPDPRDRPAFAAMMAELSAVGGYPLDLDRLFERGLERLLDGFAVLLDSTTSRQESDGV